MFHVCKVLGFFDLYQGDQNGRRTIIMNILNSYLLANTTSNRQAGQRRSKRRETAQYQFFNNEYKRRSASLVDIYSTRLKELTEESRDENVDVRWKKTIGREDNSLVVENGHRVEKTINSVNQYAEHLRVTLIKQYKNHKMQEMRSRKPQQHQQSISHRLQLQTLNLRDQVQKPSEQHLGLKQGQKSPAYKTLNLLYQAIIDNSFQKRRKDDFQLQAVRLPIVDRFNPYNQTSKSDYQPQITIRPDNTKRKVLSLPQHKIQNSKTTNQKYNKRPGVPRRKGNNHQKQQQSDIIPWRTEEQGYFE